MPLSKKLNRSLRAEEESDDNVYLEDIEGSSPSVLDTGEGGEIASSGSEPFGDSGDDEVDEDEDPSDEAGADQFQKQMSKVSFGALAKAQNALEKRNGSSRKRKRVPDTTSQSEDKLQALRERLRELKAQKGTKGVKPNKKTERSTAAHKKQRQEAEDSDADSDASDDAPTHTRSSKHALAVQSSKRRKQGDIKVKKPQDRDKAIKRQRKKVTAKEQKNIPFKRRNV